MLVHMIVHHGGFVQHNPFAYIGGPKDEIKDYDVNFLLVWEIEDLVGDIGYLNEFVYWHKLDEDNFGGSGETIKR
jgi:hypothetical protein